MNLADIYKQLRSVARIDSESRKEWQHRIVDEGMRLLQENDLLDAAARRWLGDQALTITADQIKRSGMMPRVAAGQDALWPEMEPVAGWHALKVYVNKFRRVVSRFEFCARMVGYLASAYPTEADIAKHPTLHAALAAAGVSPEDLARLAELPGLDAAA